MTLWSSANYHPPTLQERAALNSYFGGITQNLGSDWVRKHLGPEIADELERTGAILAILSGNADTLLEAEKMLQEGATPAEVRAYLRGQAVVNGVVNAATMGFGHALGVAIEKFLKIPAVQQAIKGASKAAGQKITKGLDALEGLVKSGGGAASAEEQAAIREGLDELGKLAKKNPELQSTLDELVDAASKVSPPKGLVEGFDFGKHLRGLIGDPPKGMIDPHAHHILSKKGLGPAQQALVDEGQAILRKVGIDPIYGKENLVWAPWRVSKQHGIDSLKKVVEKLRELEAAGADYDDFVNALKKLGDIAAQRGS